MTGQNGQEKIDRMPRIYHGAAGLGSRDVRPGDIIAVVHNMIDDGQDYFCVGIDHAAGAEGDRRPRPAAHGRLLDARPLGRRLRLGDHQQGHRHHRRRRLRQGRAGLSQVRLGEEGPADDVLPDHRRHAHHACTASWSTSTWCASTTRRPCSAGNPLDGLLPGGAIFMQSPYTDPADVWKRIPEHHKQDHPRQEDPRLLLRHGARSPAKWPREADLQMRMQGIVLLGAFLKLTPYAKRERA